MPEVNVILKVKFTVTTVGLPVLVTTMVVVVDRISVVVQVKKKWSMRRRSKLWS